MPNTQTMPDTQTMPLCLDDLSDREILDYRLEWEDFTENKMKSDGNCQFRALADQLYKTPDCHKLVRQEIVQQIKSHPKIYKQFVYNMNFSDYVKNMSKNSEWGDEVTLKAAADLYLVKIVVVTSIKQTPFMQFLPKSQKEPGKDIHLSYLSGIHFNSIYKRERGPASMKKLLRKKKEKEQKKTEEEQMKKKEEEKERKEKEKEEMKKDKEETKKAKEEMKRAKVKKEKKDKKNRDHHFHYSDVLKQDDNDLFC